MSKKVFADQEERFLDALDELLAVLDDLDVAIDAILDAAFDEEEGLSSSKLLEATNSQRSSWEPGVTLEKASSLLRTLEPLTSLLPPAAFSD